MSCACPHCGEPIELTVSAPKQRAKALPVEEFIEPCLIADRLGIGEAYVRKLCSRADRQGGHAGIRKIGGRWTATVSAIDALRRVSGAFP